MASMAVRLPPSAHTLIDSHTSRHLSHVPSFLGSFPHTFPPLKRREPCLCRCRNTPFGSWFPGDGGSWKNLESLLHDVAKSAAKRLDDCLNSFRKISDKGGLKQDNASVIQMGEGERVMEEDEEGDWDWERWERHFAEIEEQELIASALKVQLNDAISREDYVDAAKLKLAFHAYTKNDTVACAIHEFNNAIAEERYDDAIFLRDYAGAGLLGWWSGISNHSGGTRGQIIHVSAEYGRYVARSYNSRQLALGRPGSPLFEVYITLGGEGYKQQAVYLKRKVGQAAESSKKRTTTPDSRLSEDNGTSETPNDVSSEDEKVVEEVDDDSDLIEALANIKAFCVSPGKIHGDLVSKVIEQIIKDDEDSDEDIQDSEEEDIKVEGGVEEIELGSEDETNDVMEEQNKLSVKFVVGTLMDNMTDDVPIKDLVRVPAELDMRNHRSFSFSIKKENLQHEVDAIQALNSKAVSSSHKGVSDRVGSGPKIFIAKEKMPIKVLVDIGELINLSMNQNQNRQTLFGTTKFHRIEIPSTSDPLCGLYAGTHGMYTSEVLQLKRKFGQWQDDNAAFNKPMDVFYEYVEAYKLAGALAIPAGQVVFRAKVGKRHQLPHKGIIPEEFGVIARYKGQGRLADPGSKNPRWVDGELVILDGKTLETITNGLDASDAVFLKAIGFKDFHITYALQCSRELRLPTKTSQGRAGSCCLHLQK
ncbi:hypothetical protein HPP92_005056 [Vanilla planifolia]|uniref:Protein EXECUTER 1, chloroplastic n=1 Tax=Vanilla planifolia TaxID=51239 RepID=A0A835RT51_VANPL|nr:hypothetical protein HPP92_005056 [Vanilla planifolia]